MDAVLQRVNNLLTDLMNNTTFTVVASLVLAMYAGLAAPSLPNSVVLFFDTTLGKLLFIFLIAFVASKNVQVAIMVAVAFLVTLNVLQTRNAEGFNNYVENFISLNPDDQNPVTSGSEYFKAQQQDTPAADGDDEPAVEPTADDAGDAAAEPAVEPVAEPAVEPTADAAGMDDSEPAQSMGVELTEKFTGEYNVKPAFNLSGNPANMYAPVNF